MTDFGRMQSRIRRELRRDGLTADIRHAIASAIEYYESERFWFNEGEATAQTTDGMESIAFTTDFIQVDRLEASGSSTTTYDLIAIPFDDLRDVQQDDSTTSEPDFYALFQNRIYLDPPAIANLELRAYGLKKLTEVSASASSGATNDWMTTAEALIRQRAKADVFDNVIRNEGQGNRMRALEMQEYRKLKGESGQRMGRGRVRKTTF